MVLVMSLQLGLEISNKYCKTKVFGSLEEASKASVDRDADRSRRIECEAQQ